MSPATFNRQLLQALNFQLKENDINIRVHLGNELYIDSALAELLRKHQVNTMADSRYILVELPISGEFQDYQDILLSLMYSGYKVILAHPERYHTFQKDFSHVEELAEQGILFQCNLGSAIGQYGRSAKKTLKKLMKGKYIFAFGSDIHRKRDYSEITRAQKKIARYYKKDELEQILVKNPSAVIREGIALNKTSIPRKTTTRKTTASKTTTVRKATPARKPVAARKPAARKTTRKTI
jgi:protein-tyrosine phosphatase